MENELDVAPPVFNARFDMQPTLLPSGTDLLLLPATDEFVPLNLEWESLEDSSPLEK